MGNNNSGLAMIIAVLGLGYFLTRTPEGEVSTINGSQFPWLSPSTITKETVIKEYHYVTDTSYRDRLLEFQTVSEDAGDKVEEHNLAYLQGLKGIEKAEALVKEGQILKEMVSPTRKWTPSERTQESIDLAKRMARLSTAEQIALYKARKGI